MPLKQTVIFAVVHDFFAAVAMVVKNVFRLCLPRIARSGANGQQVVDINIPGGRFNVIEVGAGQGFMVGVAGRDYNAFRTRGLAKACESLLPALRLKCSFIKLCD